MSGSGISWAVCKFAPRSRQITTPVSPPLSFLQAGCPYCCPTNSVKALKAKGILCKKKAKQRNLAFQYPVVKDDIHGTEMQFYSISNGLQITDIRVEHFRQLLQSDDKPTCKAINRSINLINQNINQSITQSMTTTTTLHPFISLFSRTTWVSQYQKGKTSLDLSDTRGDGIVECSGISWTICK